MVIHPELTRRTSDRIGPLFPLLITTIVASVSILTIWGLGKPYPPLIAVMIFFGASSGAFVVLCSSFATQIRIFEAT
jgi:hypothetical protein